MPQNPPRKWHVAAPFFVKSGSRWLDDFIDNEALVFTKIRSPAAKLTDWHQARGKTTSFRIWISYFNHAARAFQRRPDGIVTVFPQLAMCAALIKRLTRRPVRIVAYTFNLGALPPGPKRWLARLSAPALDLVVVHSPDETARYADYLGLARDRVVFVPLQRGRLDVRREEDTEAPFILAMGSAHRDYRTLIEAVEALGIRTVIVTREDDAAALPRSPFVTFRSNMTREECHELLARARLSVTPIGNLDTASGQVTFLNAMQFGVPVIATRCPGTEGYIEDGVNGYLVAPFDPEDLREKIALLWTDATRRRAIGEAGRTYADSHFSDEGAAARLEGILLDLVPRGAKAKG